MSTVERLVGLMVVVASGVLALGGCGTRVFAFLPTPTSGPAAPGVDVAALSKKHAGNAGVILLAEDTLEHDMGMSKIDWALYAIRVRRTLVLDPEDEDVTTFELKLDDKERLTEVELLVTPPGGETRRYTRDDLIRQEKGEGKTVFKFAFPDISAGTIIETRREVTEVTDGSLPDLHHTMWLSHQLPCLQARITYAYPRRWSLRTKDTPAVRRLKGRTYKAGRGKDAVTYQLTDVPPLGEVPFSPPFRADGVYVSFTHPFVDLGQGYYEGPKSWEEYASQFKEYIVDKDAIFSRQMSSTVARVIRGLDGPEQKARALIRFIHQEIKLADKYADRDFAAVLRQGAGTAWQITGLTHQMLKEAEVPSHYVIIRSARRGLFDKSFITFGELDVAALSVELAGNKTLVLPYDKHLPAGLIPPILQGRQAIRIGEAGFDGFFTTPVQSGKENRVVERYKVRIDGGGTLHVEEEREHHGLVAYYLRRALKDLKPDELKKELKDRLTYADGAVKITRSEVTGLDDPAKPAVIQYSYRIDNLIMVAEDEAVMQTAGLLAPTSVAKDLWQSKKRHRPITIPSDSEFLREVELTLPAGWTLETLPKEDRVANKLGEVHFEATSPSPGAVRFKQSLNLKRGTHPATEMAAFEATSILKLTAGADPGLPGEWRGGNRRMTLALY